MGDTTDEKLPRQRLRPMPVYRKEGALGKSKLDGKETEITLLLQKKVSKASIARMVEVSPMTLDHFIRPRKLQPSKRQPGEDL